MGFRPGWEIIIGVCARRRFEPVDRMDLVEPKPRRESEADLIALVGAELVAASAIIGITLIEPVLLVHRPLDGDMGGPECRQPLDDRLDLALPVRRLYVGDACIYDITTG